MSGLRDRRQTFWRRRAAARRGLRIAVGAIVLVSVVALTLIVGVAAREPTMAVRAGFAAASASDGSMVWERTAARDASTQDASVRARLRALFGGAPVVIDTSAVGDPLPVAGSSRTVLPLGDDAALRSRMTGVTALQPGQASLDAAGAHALSLTIGSVLTLSTDGGPRRVRIVSIWRAKNPRSSAWNGIGAGAQGTQARVVLASQELTADGVELVARWTIAPGSSLTAAQLPALAAGYRRLAAQASSSTSFVKLEGGGAATVAGMREGVAAAAAMVPVPLAVLGAAGLLALLLVMNLLAELRAGESVLLRARGAGVWQIAVGDVRSAISPVGFGSLAGWLVAQGCLLLVGFPTGPLELVLPIVVPTGVALMAMVGSSLLGVGMSAEPSGRRGGSHRAAIAVAAVLLALAVVGVVRLLTAGAGGDLAAELAPALLIAALVVAGLQVGLPLTALIDRIARGRERVPSLLAFRRLRHRPGMVTGAIVLVALAVAASGLAATTTATSAGFLRDAGRLTTGGDLSVTAPGDPEVASGPSAPDPAALARDASASAAVPAFVEPIQLSDLDATLVAAPVHRVARVQDPALAELSTLERTGPESSAGIPVPSSGRLRVTLDISAATAPVDARLELTAWLATRDAPIVRLDLGSTPMTTAVVTAHLDAAVPAGGPWRLVALDGEIQSPATVDGLQVSVRSLANATTAAPESLPGEAWRLESAIPRADGVAASGKIGWRASGLLAEGGGNAELGRLMPTGSATVPVVLSRALAESTGLRVGDRAVLDATPGVSVRVVGIVAHTVGTTSPLGVWADLSTLQLALVRTAPELARADRVWLASDDPALAADRIAAAAPESELDPAPVAVLSRFAIPATVAAIAGAAGAVLFALIGIAAATAGLLRSRRDEILVLRALGAEQRDQEASLRIELLIALLYAVAVGALAAAVTTVITVPALAHAADPGADVALQAALRLDPLGLLAVAAVLVAATGIAVSAMSRAVRGAAGRVSSPEVDR